MEDFSILDKMHIDPYSEERPTVEKLHAFIEEKGYEFNGSKSGEKHIRYI